MSIIQFGHPSGAAAIEDFLIVFKATRDTFPDDATELESAKVAQHYDHLHRAMQSGNLVFAGRTLAGEPTAYALIRMPGYDDAKAFMRQDPAVQAGIFAAAVYPFRMSMMNDFVAMGREMEASHERNRAMGFG